MSAKEDVLEQIVEEYLLHEGYFVRHNLKFRPDPNDCGYVQQEMSNHSDIDVIGFHPLKEGFERVLVVSCKSWQAGFKPSHQINVVEKEKKSGGRDAWKGARELWKAIWAHAFIREIERCTGTTKFTHITAVTHLVGEKAPWENHPTFRENLKGNPVKILTLGEMVSSIQSKLGTTVAGTEVGRTLQLFKAAGIISDARVKVN